MRVLGKLSKDHYGALLLVVIGLVVLLKGINYQIGTLTDMGAGFVPVVLGTLMTLIGIVLAFTAHRMAVGAAAKPSQPAQWRGWICILGGVFAFVGFGVYGGLVPATFVSVFIAALGDRENSIKDALLLAVVMVGCAVAIFHWGLHLQLPLFSWG